MNAQNIMTIDGYPALITFDAESGLFRGEFLHLNGGADFYADSTAGLRQEGAISLRIFLDDCQKRGIAPDAPFSGRLSLRISPQLHAKATQAARAAHMSMNEWIGQLIERA
jgi:possible pilus related protein hicB